MNKFPFEDRILQLEEHEEDVIFIKGRPYLIKPATEDDIERVNKGFFVMD